MRYLSADRKHPVSFTLNGKPVAGSAEPRTLLADFLRREIGLTGTHVGCEHGVCGACTVRIDGKATRSCLVYAAQVEGRAVETVEALAGQGDLNDLQAAFRRHHALQCGFLGKWVMRCSILTTSSRRSRSDIQRSVNSGTSSSSVPLGAASLAATTGFKLEKSILL